MGHEEDEGAGSWTEERQESQNKRLCISFSKD